MDRWINRMCQSLFSHRTKILDTEKTTKIMAQVEIKIIKMNYLNQLKYLICPNNANYEECIDIAAEHFCIISKFKPFITLSDEKGNVFQKYTFEYYNTLFPSPEKEFYVKIDMSTVRSQQSETDIRPLGELKVKRKRWDVREEVPEDDTNVSFLYNFDVEEPAAKRHKWSVSKQNSSWSYLL